jgi:two-component system, NtrC family, sensor kinase
MIGLGESGAPTLHWMYVFPNRGPDPETRGSAFMDAAKPRRPDDRAEWTDRGVDLERQRMERALRDSEALYESLVESLAQNIFRKDRYGRFTYVNRRFCETIGKSRSDILGKTDFDLFPPAMAAKYSADDHGVFETGIPIEVVEEHRLPSGALKQVQVVKTVVLDAAGKIVGVQGIFWDITEKRLAEERLADSERRYRQLTEATLDAIVLTNEAGTVELFNPAAERMFGCRAAEVIGKAATFLDSPECRQLYADRLAAFRAGAHASGSTHELTVRRPDGSEIPIEVALSVLGSTDPSAAPVRFLAAIRDLTERRKLRATLIQNEKLASIGLLSAGVAHEINNPLSFVSNNLAVLQRDSLAIMEMVRAVDAARDRLPADLARVWAEKAEELDLPYVESNLARLLARTRDGVERVSRIVQSLRGMARTDAPRRHDVNLVDLIDGSLEIIRGKFKRSGIEVTQEHESPPIVSCVSTQISQVLLNLLVNAFQAVEAARSEGGVIAIRSRRIGNELEIAIEDNGPGIPADVLARIFDPFFTTKDVGEGTGLGLSISHSIVTGHGGRIEVDGNGRLGGACFRVYLPAKERKNG